MKMIEELLQSIWFWIKSFWPSGGGPSIYQIHLRRLRVLRKIGEGGFSFIYLVRCSEPQTTAGNGTCSSDNDADSHEDDGPESHGGVEEKGMRAVYALKRINVLLDEQETAFFRELEYHISLSGRPNIIRLIDGELVSTGSERYGLLLLPLYRQGSAQELFCQRYIDSGEIVKKDILLKLSADICNGLLSLHTFDPPLAFRDLKPANVLIGMRGDAVLADLGSVDRARLQIRSRREALALEEQCMEQCTNLYRPPELFQVPSECDLDERTDVWSLGCTLYAIMYGYSPFDGSATSAMSGQLKFPANNGSGDLESIHALLERMIQISIKDRPFVTEILEAIK